MCLESGASGLDRLHNTFLCKSIYQIQQYEIATSSSDDADCDWKLLGHPGNRRVKGYLPD